MFLRVLLVTALCFSVMMPHKVSAQEDYVETNKHFLNHGDKLPRSLAKGDFKSEVEPQFRAVQHKPLDPPKTLRNRIEMLVFGINTDIPPEYDRYGYNIRRFMAHVGGPLVLKSPQNLEGQLQNIKTAKKLLKNWRDELNTEIKALSDFIDEQGASSAERSLFKYNSSVVYRFLIDMSDWLLANEEVLEYLLGIGAEGYSFEDPVFMFYETKHMTEFRGIYEQKTRALNKMTKEYPSFRMMIY